MLGSVFDPSAELLVEERLRPHWAQAGAIVFVTFRTADSIPRSVLSRWDREKDDWMKRHGMPQHLRWSEFLTELDVSLQSEFRTAFTRKQEDFLDSCYGQCVLRDPIYATIVANALLHFDGQRYRLGDFVVMPNHVHLLAAFANPETMRKQFDSWLHYTAGQIHHRLGRRGHFWQQEPFDHLVRTVEQYQYLRRYIADNPKKAKLRIGEYLVRRY